MALNDWIPAAPTAKHVAVTARAVIAATLTLSLAGCGDESQINALKQQVAEREQEVAALRAQITAKDAEIASKTTEYNKIANEFINSRNNEGYYKGVVDANKGSIDTLQKTLAICMAPPQPGTGVALDLKKVTEACTKTSDDIKTVTQNPPPVPVDLCKSQPDDPACKPLPPAGGAVSVDDAPPAGSDVKKDDMEKTVMLAAAYLACQYYSAGTCSIIIAALGIKFGMGEGEVQANSEQAFKKLKSDIDKRGVAIPNPLGGPPLVFNSKVLNDVRQANEAYRALPETARHDPCRVIEIYRNVSTINPFLADLKSPLSFRNQTQKANALRAARQIDAGFAMVLERVPVAGTGLTCG